MNHQEVRHSQSLSTTGEKEGKENQDTHTDTPREHRPDPSRPHTLLPGITEIVFNALRTLNVRRAETLPRLQTQLYTCNDQIKVTWRHGHDLVLDDFHAD